MRGRERKQQFECERGRQLEPVFAVDSVDVA